MVDDRRDTTVGVEFGEFRCLVLLLVEVKVDGVVRETELLENIRDLPAVGPALVSGRHP